MSDAEDKPIETFTAEDYQALMDSFAERDEDCAHCLMPLQVTDLVVDGAGNVITVVYSHATTGDMYCDDQAPPYNLASPRT
ncbi:hypothetical protein SEA_DALANDE_93 [Gordonia phage DalanDe]|nr:hypothetical protein SEA_DALANDE_93 [Gordonia phage DalanDe]